MYNTKCIHACFFILCLLLHQHCGKYHSSLNRHEPCLLLSLLTLPGRRQGGDLVTAYVSLQARTPQQWGASGGKVRYTVHEFFISYVFFS